MFTYFFLAVNKQMTSNKRTIFYLITEYSGFVKYTLNKLDLII